MASAKQIEINGDCLKTTDIFDFEIANVDIKCGFEVGKVGIVTQQEINNKLTALHINAEYGSGVQVLRTGEAVTDEQVIKLLQDEYAIKFPDVSIKVEHVGLNGAVFASKSNDLHIGIDSNSQTPFGNIRFTINNGNKDYSGYAFVRAFQQGYVAVNAINRGDEVTRNVVKSEVDVTYLHDKLADDVAGFTALGYVPANKPITSRMLRMTPLAKKGDTIPLVYSSGKIMIKAFGVLQQDAYNNATVIVKNSGSNKTITGLFNNGYATIQ